MIIGLFSDDGKGLTVPDEFLKAFDMTVFFLNYYF